MGGLPVTGRISAQSYERSYSALRLCTLSCESGGPMSRGRPQRGERVGAETIDQSPDDGALCRAARDDEARSSHPCPGDCPLPPASSGVPVRDCAQSARGQGRGVSDHGEYRLPRFGPRPSCLESPDSTSKSSRVACFRNMDGGDPSGTRLATFASAPTARRLFR